MLTLDVKSAAGSVRINATELNNAEYHEEVTMGKICFLIFHSKICVSGIIILGVLLLLVIFALCAAAGVRSRLEELHGRDKDERKYPPRY